jgi:hypothetical protein
MENDFMRLKPYFFLVIFFGISGGGNPVVAEEIIPSNCRAIFVDLDSVSSKDQALVCDGVEKAYAFFRHHGIEIQRQIHFKLHKTGIKNHPAHIGLYGAKKDYIDLLTLEHAKDQCAKLRPFGMQMNETLYVSFVVHEVTHAIVDQNLKSRPSSLIIHEYLAYVAQLATMEVHSQKEILQRYDLEPFTGLEDMSPIYYGLNPSAFGVKAFRHYQSLTEHSRFIQNLLTGDIKPSAQQ